MKYFRSGKVALPIVGFGFQEMRLGSVNLQQNGSYTFVSSPSPKKKNVSARFLGRYRRREPQERERRIKLNGLQN